MTGKRMTQLTTKTAGTRSPAAVMTVICLGIFVASLDQTVIYGALPDMMATIMLPVTKLDQAAWIVIGYLLGFTFAMPLIGRLSDVYGHSRIYILSLVVFMAGSVLVTLSKSIEWMVGARIVQAVGGGALVPVAMAITGSLYTGGAGRWRSGVIGAVVEAGGALGRFTARRWRSFSTGNGYSGSISPSAARSSSWCCCSLKRAARPGEDRLSERHPARGGPRLAVRRPLPAERPAGLPGYMLSFLAAAAACFAVFAVCSLRIPEPLVRLSVFKNRVFSAANLTNVFVGGALIIAMVDIPLMSDTILGCTPLEGGLRLLRFTVSLSLGALAGGFLTKRFGYRPPTVAGLLLSAAGFYFMSGWTLSIADPALTLHLAACGFGFGLVIAPLGTAVMDSVDADHKGLASSMVVMMRMIGMMVGMSAITAWGMERFHLMTATLTLQDMIDSPEKVTGSLLILFNNFFKASIFLCLIAVVPALFLRRKKEPPDRAGK
jgi:MFS family permease